MKKSARNIWALPALLLASTPAFASGHNNGLDGLAEVIVILLCAMAVVVISLILAMLSYRSASKVLNIAAWITVVTSLLIAAGFAVFGRGAGGLVTVVPLVAVAFLLARIEKNAEGSRFVVACILRCIALISSFLFFVAYLGEAFLFRYFGQFGYPFVAGSGAAVLLGFLVYRMLLRSAEKNIAPVLSPVIVCLVIGAGVYIIQLIYTMLVVRSYGGFDRFAMPYIYYSAVIHVMLSIVTGLVVKARYSPVETGE